jgi:uncharacterized protein YoxC
MADKDILDAVLRMEANNREDHAAIQTQIRGYASRTIKLETKVEELEKDVRKNCMAISVVKDKYTGLRGAVENIKGQWKVVLGVTIPTICGAGAILVTYIMR